jgi:PTH1 family peptidyl-tRNA hydrolase
LGNPGSQYDGTRHNAGFEAVDLLAARLGIKKIRKLKFQALYQTAEYMGKDIVFIKPQTFMNESGRSVRLAASFYNVPPEHVVVIYDDVNLPVGYLRIRASGSDGGHNGMKSILYHLQSDAFPRIRIGVGTPPDGEMADWVLSGFSVPERKIINETVERACGAAETLVTHGVIEAMNRYNGMAGNEC